METIKELQDFLSQATQEDAWGQLLYRGMAKSLVQTKGVLPDNAPKFATTIETDLANYGFALLRAAIVLRSRNGAIALTNKAFECAGKAFEALIRNADPEAPDRGFRRTIAAAAYHLAGFSAVAYSIFNEVGDDLNLTSGETAIMRLILRDLDGLRTFVRNWLSNEAFSDDHISTVLSREDADLDELLANILRACS